MTLGEATRVALPTGVLDGDRRDRTAVLRPLSGREEELLATLGPEVPAAERVTLLLARCVQRLGPRQPDADDVRGLTVGDREALLLHLRRITVGDRLDCLLRCPHDGCGEPVDVELRASELIVPACGDLPPWHEEELELDDRRVRVRFRLPTGADQEAVAGLARDDAAAAARLLLDRCAQIVGAGADAADTLGEDAMAALSARMADLDPQAELRLQTVCPVCGGAISTLFDSAAFLFAEIGAAADRLYEEVHALAWYYHWSEGDILDLTADRRRRYLDLIAWSLQRARERGAA